MSEKLTTNINVASSYKINTHKNQKQFVLFTFDSLKADQEE